MKREAPPPLALGHAGPRGSGVYARTEFPAGAVVLHFAGPLLLNEAIEDFTYTIQVDRGLHLGPSGGIDDFVNHSCEPSTTLASDPPRIWLVAARDIRAGEEITFDYSTCLGEEPVLPVCFCGSASCRGFIGTFWELPPSLQAYYRSIGAVPRYVLDERFGSVGATAGDAAAC